VDFLTVAADTTVACPNATAVGVIRVRGEAANPEPTDSGAVYNLEPPPGAAAKFGFHVLGVGVTLTGGARSEGQRNFYASLTDITQAEPFFGSKLILWGDPAARAHDEERGHCLTQGGKCPVSVPERAFLTLPTSCTGPLTTTFRANSWQDPAAQPFVGSATSPATSECAGPGFDPTIAAQPTNRSAQSPTGLDFDLDVSDPGLTSPSGIADSQIKTTVVTLPKGVTLNPSQAEGLGTCSEAELAAERPDSGPGEGCPQSSKVGTIEVTTPLLEEPLGGAIYVATPYENPTGSLIAIYIVIRDPQRGILVKQAGMVAPDPASGQLRTTVSDLPQIPFSHFDLHFREGGRSPLVTPPGCGRYTTVAKLTPWARPDSSYETSASFQITSGPSGGSCPPGGAPFTPGFEAGTANNAAGHYSPFLMRITRQDGEQDLSRFSAVLPPGVVGRIAGIPYCPETGIAQAKARTGPHGAAEELSNPSCPAASQIGRTIAGAGVGSQLTYVPGSLYLAGPYHADPLSVVSITPALAGPFDAGTVVVREALDLNPISAEVQVDGRASDPIPHILKGIPLSLRDLRVYVDRPQFTLNATSCEEEQARATLWGAGTALAPAGETPVGLAARYQAAGCASLPFKPKLAIKLKGGTKRGAHPALRAVVTPRPFKDANFSRALVTLPRSAFLDQAHIRTVCTRVQYAAGAGHGAACPNGSIYGHARAWTPLLAQPLAGPVYLRSSNNKLPDLIASLHGLVDIELGARIDSVKGGIRTAFIPIPDAPVSRFILDMQGGKKGLIVNSKNLCRKRKRNRAMASLGAQNGRRRTLRPVVRAVKCKNRKRGHPSHSKPGTGRRKYSTLRGEGEGVRTSAPH
jgi:hypothetical protein